MQMTRSKIQGFHLFLLILLLTGCSLVSLAYNNAATALYWYFDDYFEFNSTQRVLYDQGFQRIQVWHRKMELPKYAALCAEAALRVESGLKQADLDWLENALRTRFNVLASHSAGDLATLFATLEPAQLDNLDRNFAKSNAKFVKEHLSGTREARETKRIKESLARIEEWVGELQPDQEASVVTMLRSMPQMSQQRYAHRLARQQAIRGILASRLGRDKLEVALNQWMIHWEGCRSAEHERLWGQWLERNRQLILRLDAMLTPQQWKHLTNRLREYSEDFTRLREQ